MQTNITLVRNHIKNQHEQKPCIYCGEMFGFTRMKDHIMSKHKTIADREFKCEFCGKGFISKTQLKEHINIHTGEKPHLCRFCGAAFSASGTKHNHERLVHLKSKKKSDGKRVAKKRYQE